MLASFTYRQDFPRITILFKTFSVINLQNQTKQVKRLKLKPKTSLFQAGYSHNTAKMLQTTVLYRIISESSRSDYIM